MAIAFDASSGADTGAGTSTTLSWSHTCTGTNLVLVVNVVTASITSITYDGVAMTSIATTSVNKAYILIAPHTGTHTITVTLPSAGQQVAVATSYTGVGQTTPTRTVATRTPASSSDVTVTATSAVGDVVLSMPLTVGASTNTLTAGTGVTARANRQWALSPYQYVAAIGEKAGAASTTVSAWSMNTGLLAGGIIGFALIPAAGGGTNHALAGDTVSVSGASGAVSLAVAVKSATASVSSSAGGVVVAVSVTGVTSSVSAASASVVLDHPLAGDTVSASVVITDRVQTTKTLAGDTVSVSAINAGELALEIGLGGQSVSISDVVTMLRLAQVLAGGTESTSVVLASLTVEGAPDVIQHPGAVQPGAPDDGPGATYGAVRVFGSIAWGTPRFGGDVHQGAARTFGAVATREG